MAWGMKLVLIGTLLLSRAVFGQDAHALQRALKSGKVERVDHWMKRFIRDHRKGHLVLNGSTTYIIHQATYDTLVAFLRKQPGVLDATWDACLAKAAIWPGRSTIGMRWEQKGRILERCWTVQEGRPGNIGLWGWHPQVRKAREELRYGTARECTGFVAEQRRNCEAMLNAVGR